MSRLAPSPTDPLRPGFPSAGSSRGGFVTSPPPDNRGSAKRDAKFVGDEIRRLLESRAVEICPAPRVISPLSIAQGDPASLLSRALLHSIAEAQKTFSSPSAPIPLSPDEADSQPQELSPSIHSPTFWCRERCVFPGAKSTLLQCLASTVTRAEPALLPVLLEAISGSKAEATMKSYRASMKNLRLYAKDRGLDPACPSTLLIYTLKKIEEGRALSTLKIVSSAFSHFDDPLSQTHSHILSYLQDSTRKKCVATHHSPVDPSIIDSFVQYSFANPSDPNAIRTTLGASLSFSALLRVNELLSLRWDDLSWSEDTLRVSVKKAKNDQFGEGRDTFIAVDKNSLCLSLFHSYKESFPPSPWVFSSRSHPDRAISTDAFRKDLSGRSNGIDPSRRLPGCSSEKGEMEINHRYCPLHLRYIGSPRRSIPSPLIPSFPSLILRCLVLHVPFSQFVSQHPPFSTFTHCIISHFACLRLLFAP
ncbi:hypothetical protein PENTCL1PPCAC_30264 [Pristionchus entomophagus]|uniref:Tyr recombinase domain-containing protein n=1 Tax=Pristionchus entomophagus TaxID=358040 RepID=A0AAV5U430_9BILA|nr:hypothetical protein PENTCL1PPCAC_23436 [Pristionchus entomophagus]GMT08090.1 hypothetical protein PENTCL1PPCAC_30264 [Pristionchus entomophagus]